MAFRDESQKVVSKSQGEEKVREEQPAGAAERDTTPSTKAPKEGGERLPLQTCEGWESGRKKGADGHEKKSQDHMIPDR